MCQAATRLHFGASIAQYFLERFMPQNLFSKFLLFADDLKIFCAIKSVKDFELLQTDIDCMQKWCIENYTKFNLF
jgi:hypothetical protein